MEHWRRRNVDFKLGFVMLAGGGVGTVLGVWLFGYLQRLGHIDLVISLSYVLFLGVISSLMLLESVRAILRGRGAAATRSKRHHHTWLHGRPFKVRVPIGGGFLLVPAMIYLLGMPTVLVAGTSLFQIIFTTGIAAFMQASLNQTVDVVLALLLLVGGVIGAQFGTKAGTRLRGEQARALLAMVVLAVAVKLAVDLVLTPEDLFSITMPTDG